MLHMFMFVRLPPHLCRRYTSLSTSLHVLVCFVCSRFLLFVLDTMQREPLRKVGEKTQYVDSLLGNMGMFCGLIAWRVAFVVLLDRE